ncbi:MAG TPA: Asp-tRNA(Asn)/Glu-tRNA(Gln) amidotransferase subunit GatB [Dehalococcoidia bacterium]|nr:Asp-tRNA(Asn)/Glu-tRNA(Gln) amidotransferase subunit GatB [Dehalococcoidia bacterium]
MTTATETKYEAVIGLEVHVQLLTERKMFCGCSAAYADAPPNTHVCPVCMALPGVLPVINEKAVELVIMTGLALNCEIPEYAKFDRKNYPYPDLLKGYQISQYDLPLTVNGWMEIEVEGQEPKRVGITRAHLEEDTARLTHKTDASGESYSLIDMNRAGVPLMEIVGEPDMRSPEEATAYLVKLRQILRYIGVSKANMEEGNFRCDANISLRPAGSTAFGSKVEVKNMNSFRSVERALRFEVERQASVLDAGEKVPQETRGWVEAEGRTVSQRSKEEAHDYRYFPEPDLPPVTVDRAWVERVRARLPELPDAKRRRFESQYGLTRYEADLLTATEARASYFERVLAAAPVKDGDTFLRYAKQASNWMLGEFARLLNASDMDIADARIDPAGLCAMIALVEEGTITGTIAKSVFEEMFRTGKQPQAIIEELGLQQISASDELSAIVERVLAANPRPVEDYRAGKQEAIKFLVGQAMRETRGRANPATLTELLKHKLDAGA